MHQNNDFSTVTIKHFQSSSAQERNPIYIFLFCNMILTLLLLISMLKPPHKYKTLVSKISQFKFSCCNFKFKINHFILLIIGFYITLYVLLKLKVEELMPDMDLSYAERVIMADKRWVIESEIWMTFLIIVSYLSIYRNIILFHKEIDMNDKIKEIDGKLLN